MNLQDSFNTGNEVRVENTNSESLLSKLSLVELGLIFFLALFKCHSSFKYSILKTKSSQISDSAYTH